MQNTKQNHLRCFVTFYLSDVMIFHLSDVNEGVRIICQHHRHVSLVPIEPQQWIQEYTRTASGDCFCQMKFLNDKSTSADKGSIPRCFCKPSKAWLIRLAEKQWNPAASMILAAFHEPQLIHPPSGWGILHAENPAKLHMNVFQIWCLNHHATKTLPPC